MKKTEKRGGWLVFSRKERLGLLILTLLVFVLFLLPDLLPEKAGLLSGPPDTAWVVTLRQTTQEKKIPEYQQSGNAGSRGAIEKAVQPVRLFHFDPNTLDPDGWRKLGLREKTIQTIRRYIDKGGRFRKPEDLGRIYGLFPDEFERLRPYIRLPASPEPVQTETGPRPALYPAVRKIMAIDINTADTSAWIALPGIGSRLANRITLFREKLGGFYAVSQVAETFGLADSVFRKIEPLLRLETSGIRKININTVKQEELQAHPYFRRELARPVIAYRNEHGSFHDLRELKNIQAVSETVWNKIVPYLTLQ